MQPKMNGDLSRGRGRLFAAALLTGIVAFSPYVQAQVIVDVAKITCEQYLTFKVANPQEISIWLSGYFHGRNGSLVIDTQQLRENFDKLKQACFLRENLKRPFFSVAEEHFAKGK
jgi:acid stress chaperone HdeB